MKKILSTIMLSSLVFTGLLFWIQNSSVAQTQTTTVFSQTQIFPRPDNGQPLYYQTGDEISDDIGFVGQRKISSFAISYRSTAPVNVVYRFYNYSLTTPIVQDDETPGARIPARGQLVKEIRETNLPAGDHTRAINLPTAEQFTFGTPPDRELAQVRGDETDKSIYGGSGVFTIQFTDVNGNNSGTAAGSLITNEAEFIPSPRQIFAEYVSNIVINNVSQSDRNVFEPEVTGVIGNSGIGLYLEISGVNVTAPPPPPATPTPTPTPISALSAVTISPSSVRFGTSAIGTVILTAPTANGATVALSSSSTGAATAPTSVTVAPGATSATFVVTASTIRANNYAVITATFENSSRQATLAIMRR